MLEQRQRLADVSPGQVRVAQVVPGGDLGKPIARDLETSLSGVDGEVPLAPRGVDPAGTGRGEALQARIPDLVRDGRRTILRVEGLIELTEQEIVEAEYPVGEPQPLPPSRRRERLDRLPALLHSLVDGIKKTGKSGKEALEKAAEAAAKAQKTGKLGKVGKLSKFFGGGLPCEIMFFDPKLLCAMNPDMFADTGMCPRQPDRLR